MTLDCNGLRNGQSRVISFLWNGRRAVFFRSGLRGTFGVGPHLRGPSKDVVGGGVQSVGQKAQHG